MALNQQQGSVPQGLRYCNREIEMCPDGVQPRAPMPKVAWTAANELINVNHLIEDVGSFLPAPMVENLLLAYDLAPDLPLVEGDYRLIRRLLLRFLCSASGMISLKTRLTQADRDYLTDNFPGANLPEGNYVVIQATEMDSGTNAASKPEFRSICQFIFPCQAGDTGQRQPAETVEPRLVRQEHGGPNRKWLIMQIQRAAIKGLEQGHPRFPAGRWRNR